MESQVPKRSIVKACILLLSCMAGAFVSYPTLANTEIVDGITWTYTVSNGAATVGGGSSSSPAIATSTSGVITVPSTLGGVPVKEIAKYAFYQHTYLTSVTLPAGVTSIGTSAFAGCSALRSVTIPSSVTSIGATAFSDCSALWSVTIPGSVTNIGEAAFQLCSTFTRVSIPGSVRSISDYAFLGCRNLTSVTISSGVTSIGASAFSGCSALRSVTIPSSVTSIGKAAFKGCSDSLFDTASIPGIKLVDGWAIDDVGSLSGDLDLTGVRGIGDSAFADCIGLTSVIIPVGVTSIGSSTFQGCSALWRVTIPDSVTSIGASAFEGCSDSLFDTTSIPGVKLVDGWAICGVGSISGDLILTGVRGIADSAFMSCSGLTSVIIPDSVTGIGFSAFSGCSALESMTLPFVGSMRGNAGTADALFGYVFGTHSYVGGMKAEQNFSSSDYVAYYVPSALKTVTITDETKIGYGAFSGCRGLTSVTIPNSVTSIGAEAFEGCSDSLFDTASIPGIKLVDGWAIDDVGSLSGDLDLTGVRGIGDSAFADCIGLTSVIIPVGVLRIGNHAFQECYCVTNVAIQNSVRTIGECAFYGCVGLSEIVVPNSVTSIGMGCFSQCTNLVSMTLPFIGTGRGISGKNALFGCIFGTTAYDGGEATRQHYSTSGSIVHYIPTSLRRVVITDEGLIGFGAFYGCSGLTEIAIPDGVTNIGDNAFNGCSGMLNIQIPNGVVGIGDRAFVGCRGLTSVTIPNSVTSIGERLFAECANLESMTLPFVGAARGVETGLGSVFGHIWGIVNFQGGTNAVFTYLTGNGTDTATISCYLPESLKSVVITDESVVARGAFEQCSCLTNIVLNESVTAVGDCAFNGCSGLTRVTIPDSVEYIGEHAFDGCGGLPYGDDGYIIVNGWVLGYSNPEVTSLVIPDGVIGIGGSAFADFWDLEEVVFPDTLRYIGGGAFDTCTGLDNVVIPDGVEIIGDGAFRNCTYMRNITIGESVTSIGDEAFAGCTQLSSLSVPDNVTEIGDAAFSNCWRMLSVRLPLGLESVGVNMFSGCTSLTGVTTPTHAFTMNRIFGDRYTALASVSVSAGETKVCDSAFAGCSALTSVVMPNAITNIGNSAFASCSHLAGLELPESLDVIGAGAFSNCTALAAIVLPDEVTAIGQRAFYGCTSLANVTLSRSLASIPDYAFHGCSKLNSMVVPASVNLLGAYIGNYFSSLYYLGNAPSYDANVYASRSRTVTTYVVQGSRGWDGIPSSRDLPTSWNGYGITFWEPNRFDATFDANGGTFFDGSTAYACEQITDTGYALPPYEPTLEGFVFDGWWSDPYEGAQIKASVRVNETRDITFYAHWAGKPSSITVRFNPNGGTVEPDEGQYYSTLTYETLPVPTREHYKFAGWWTKAVGGNKIVASSRVPAADQELFAHWTPETYTIRYNANGGTGSMADQSFVYGSAVVLRANAFSKADKNFVGWAVAADGAVVYPDGGSLGSVAAIENGIINLYAVWRGNSYAVRFDSNGGVGSMDNATFEMDEQRSLPACTFTRDGFDFAGWATSPDGEPVYSDRAVVSALTSEVNGSFVLYAVWRAFTVEVPVVTPGDGSVFVGDSCEVSITCATVGATIYYSTTGKAPKLTDKNRYTGAFIITNTTTIYAVATRGEAMAYAVVTISKQELTLQYVLGDGGKIGVSTSPDFPWGPVADNMAAIGYSARSALPTEDDMDSWVELSVMGAGTLSFKCRTSCEWDYTGGCEFDCLMAATNGVEIVGMRLDGIQDNWVDRAVTFSGDGEHKLRIIYHKDESDFDGEDCAWLGDVHWTPAGAAAPIPAVAVDADAATVNATVDEVGFADAAVKEVIGGSAEKYNSFKTWADGVKGATGDALAGEAAVVANAHAASAYLLGAERLFENEPTVEIGELSIAEGESVGTIAMTVAVTVKDGESAVAVSAAKVAAMFEATGDLGDWTGAAKLTPTVTTSGTDESGKMTFVVTPGDGAAAKAFLRIRK